MHSTPPPPARRREANSLIHRVRPRLRVSSRGVSQLSRRGQGDRCRKCGNRIEWYRLSAQQPLRLHPHERPAARGPAARRRHVSSGVAYPGGGGSSWYHLAHIIACPARDMAPLAELTGLRRALTVSTLRPVDAGHRSGAYLGARNGQSLCPLRRRG
ncbi:MULTISPECIES: DUF6083 domain-containing protein [Streptomyces]|uniref:DUF6083 domain-containing protein n=1 Tax=Streptomyces TaxID=1883 RepID=UPI0035A9265B